MKKNAKWRVSKLAVEGYQAIELSVRQDPREKVRELAVVGRRGELYGYSIKGEVAPFRGLHVWDSAALTRIKALPGLKKISSCCFQVVDRAAMPFVIRLLDLAAAPDAKTCASLMNNINGLYEQLPARIDDLRRSVPGGGKGRAA